MITCTLSRGLTLVLRLWGMRCFISNYIDVDVGEEDGSLRGCDPFDFWGVKPGVAELYVECRWGYPW